MSEPTFETRTDARGALIVCTFEGEIGAARVMSAGENEAKQRAEAQARAKAKAKRGPAG